ncbi:hypothetical protein DPMN_012990 [Dreissena polymorpha]|uniref:Uncharacterized protein n=1 Tax=Dreissena polymorpha TaxID=45954 RepID=A0A9D4S390_DREPO|nr:hypothetical protein DPMN_012990 [Dreissena polymorpha]
MLDQLLPRLEGLAAQFAFSQLSPNLLNDYQFLVEELDSRFRVIETPRSLLQNSAEGRNVMARLSKSMQRS